MASANWFFESVLRYDINKRDRKSVFVMYTDCVLCALETHLCTYFRQILSSRKAGFDPRPNHMRFVTDKVIEGWVCFWVIIILTILHTRRKNCRNLETYQKHWCFGNPGTLLYKILSSIFRPQLYK